MKFQYYLFCLALIPAILKSQSPDTTAVEIAVEPKILSKPRLEFPPFAAEAGVVASIKVKIAVGEDGKPYLTEIMSREPQFAYSFDEVARKWAMKCEFSPALNKYGEPVKVWVAIPIRFKLEGFEPPVVVEQAVPEYPEVALEMGMQGWVGVAVLVDDMGRTIKNNKVIVIAREPANTKVFDDAATDAARRSKFTPATQNGSKTNGWAFLKFEFKISH